VGPLVTFVIPAYNEAENLPWLIASIQADTAWADRREIIVVDNNSTDDTAKVALACGARVFTESRKGIVHARQAGFLAASGKFVAFVDADNLVPLGWIKRALDSFDFDTVAVSGPLRYLNSSSWLLGASKVFYSVAWLAHQIFPMLQGGNFMIKRSALHLVNGFDTTYQFFGEDSAQAIRLSRVGKIKFVMGMVMPTSPRRLQSEGVIRTTFLYVVSYLWVNLFGRPWTQHYNDIRQGQ
jgi:glycosyltransferase involved in cell wall biosynthesis